jgi:hypothetical protein
MAVNDAGRRVQEMQHLGLIRKDCFARQRDYGPPHHIDGIELLPTVGAAAGSRPLGTVSHTRGTTAGTCALGAGTSPDPGSLRQPCTPGPGVADHLGGIVKIIRRGALAAGERGAGS